MSRRFGRYLIRDELTEELGRGAFGRVYRAFDPNINRYVAIKVLSSSTDPEMLVRFQDESKTAGKLEHENIVKVYDFDLQDGMPYLVMELLDGETLDTIIRTQKIAGVPLQLLDKIQIMFQVGKGLQYAHAENVVHRDIKPGNIMVLPNGTVKVMDFGIARVMDKDGTRRTRQGDIAGTILYMAPEQFNGRDADKRSDIFAYAVVFYELLTGEHPFSGGDSATVMYRITTYEPRSVKEKVPECPAALESLIQRMLVKDPEIRPERLDDILLKTRLVLQRLRRERAAVLGADIEPLIKSGDRDKAEIVIARVLKLDPLNQEAEHWQSQFQQERDALARRMRAEALVRQGRGHLDARRFKEVLQAVESAQKLDPENAEIASFADQVRLTLENVRQAGVLLADARTEIEQDKLEDALERTVRAAELDPGDRQAVELREHLRNQIRICRETAALTGAEALMKCGDYDAALSVLDEPEAERLASPKIAALRVRVAHEREVAEKRRCQAALAAALAKGREALAANRLQEASDAAEALCAEWPEEPAGTEFRSEVQEHIAFHRRLEGIKRVTQTARALLKEKNLDMAREVLKDGLRLYSGDASISRMFQLVETLAAAQDRARKISQAVRQSRILADEGRLDEALQSVIEAIAEFGEESVLLECKRNYQLERDQREYARDLQAWLEQGRRLLAEGDPRRAVELLENAMAQYPGEPEIATLLSSARSALSAFREGQLVKQHLTQIAMREALEQYAAGLALTEAALARYPNNVELQETAPRLRQKLRDQERSRLLAKHLRDLDEAFQSGDWDAAVAKCENARLDFPEEPVLAEYSERIQEARRRQGLRELQADVRSRLGHMDLEAAERELDDARPRFAQDPTWQELWRELERIRSYDRDMQSAAEACAAGDYDRAELLLQPWFAEPSDARARNILETLSQRRRAAAEQARSEAEERQREEFIAGRRGDAEVLVREGDYAAAIAILDELAGLYPARQDIQRDREAAGHALDRQRHNREAAAIAQRLADANAFTGQREFPRALAILDELDERYPGRSEILAERERVADHLRRQQAEDATLAEGLRRALAALENSDPTRALAILDELDRQYPGRDEIQRQRDAANEALERQSRKAEDLALYRAADAPIAQGRREVQSALDNNDPTRALAILDELDRQYPGRPEIRRQREAANQALERQRREPQELARRKAADATIAKARLEAHAALEKNDPTEAVRILHEVDRQYPGRVEIQADRERAAAARDRVLQQQADNAAIARALSKAQSAVTLGEYQRAVDILNLLSRQYPNRTAIEEARDAAIRELDRWRRRKEEADISKGRGEAASLVRQGQHADAIKILDQLIRRFPDRPEIRQDREQVAEALERRPPRGGS